MIDHNSPSDGILLGVVESSPPSVTIGASATWNPSWGYKVLGAWDGSRYWDLARPEERRALKHQLSSASRVVVSHIPYDMADWVAPWWPIVTHERALTLGRNNRNLEQGEVLLRYPRATADSPLQWSPTTWPFSNQEPPPIDYLVRQAQGLHAALSAVYHQQRHRTSVALLQELERISMPCERVHARLWSQGVDFDYSRCQAIHQDIAARVQGLRGELSVFGILEPEDDNLVKAWLDEVGLGDLFVSGVTTDLLKEYEARHPALKPLRQARRLSSLLSQGWLRGHQTGPDGRMHLRHITLAAPTGRTTTIEPALGSVPKEYRSRILTPSDPDWAYDDADFSGFELFVAAAVSRDEALAACCRSGKPVAALAQVIFPQLGRQPILDIPSTHRDLYDQAKTIVYGTIYGQTHAGLASKLNCSKDAAGALQERLFCHCPKLRTLARQTATIASEQGIIPIAFGLVRRLQPEDTATPGRLQRLAANTPIQGAAATCFRAVTLVADKVICRHGGQILLPLHDGLHYIAPRKVMPELVPALTTMMQAVFRTVLKTDLAPPVSSEWMRLRETK